MNGAPPRPPQRLNRFLARAGCGSRRSVESLIWSGRVSLNGVVVTTPAQRVDPNCDRVEVDGYPVTWPDHWSIYAFHKPLGVVCTFKPYKGQTGLLPFRKAAGLPERIMPVGRLDAETSGLLLWTDDGDLAQALCRPATRVWKRYEVVLDEALTVPGQVALAQGQLSLDGYLCRPWRLSLGSDSDPRHWIVELHEGRKRQIRRMLALLGLEVLSLKRVGVGPVHLGSLKEGCFRQLKELEESPLRQAAGVA
jgi:pseudouridine synthase